MMVHLDNLDEKGQYHLPGDLDAIDWATAALLFFALALLIIVLLAVPGPH